MVMIATPTQIEQRKGQPKAFRLNSRVAPPGEAVRTTSWENDVDLPRSDPEDYYAKVLNMHRECKARNWPYAVVMGEMIDRWMANPVPPNSDDAPQPCIDTEKRKSRGRERVGYDLNAIRMEAHAAAPTGGDRAPIGKIIGTTNVMALPKRVLEAIRSWPEFELKRLPYGKLVRWYLVRRGGPL
jgi:hypothetical protein